MDRDVKEVKYLAIAEDLQLKILSKIYKPGDLLPSESTLTKQYKTSRITARGALNYLEEKGYIYTKAGVGSFIKDTHDNRFKIDLNLDSLLNDGYDKIELYDAKIVKPDLEIVYVLKIHTNQKVVFIEWGIQKNEQKIAYSKKYIPYIKGLTLDERDLTFKSLRDMLKKVPGEGYERITLKELKNQQLMEGKLDMQEEDDKILLIEHLILDNQNSPIGLEELYVLASRCTIKGTQEYE